MANVLILTATNKIVLASLVAWLIAQAAKILLLSGKHKHFKASWMVKPGGMPSGHAAALSALTIAILLQEGVSSLFALSLVVSVALLRHLINKTKGSHSLTEVIVGIIIGTITALVIA